jgi:hypothetical protein
MKKNYILLGLFITMATASENLQSVSLWGKTSAFLGTIYTTLSARIPASKKGKAALLLGCIAGWYLGKYCIYTPLKDKYDDWIWQKELAARKKKKEAEEKAREEHPEETFPLKKIQEKAVEKIEPKDLYKESKEAKSKFLKADNKVDRPLLKQLLLAHAKCVLKFKNFSEIDDQWEQLVRSVDISDAICNYINQNSINKKVFYKSTSNLETGNDEIKENGPLEFEIKNDESGKGIRTRWQGLQLDKANKDKNIITNEDLKIANLTQKKIAELYKIHLMPPSEKEDLKQPTFWLATDLEAAADLILDVLDLLHEDEKFFNSVDSFKFLPQLSILRYQTSPYPFIVLYPQHGKKNAQIVADKLYKKINIKSSDSNLTSLTPRHNKKFGEDSNKPIYYLLGDGQCRNKSTYKFAPNVYDGTFFKEKFVGRSKEEQMLKEPTKN